MMRRPTKHAPHRGAAKTKLKGQPPAAAVIMPVIKPVIKPVIQHTKRLGALLQDLVRDALAVKSTRQAARPLWSPILATSTTSTRRTRYLPGIAPYYGAAQVLRITEGVLSISGPGNFCHAPTVLVKYGAVPADAACDGAKTPDHTVAGDEDGKLLPTIIYGSTAAPIDVVFKSCAILPLRTGD
ncbi:hypothetical protein AMAG_14494 [Allomyces macrogynus ATCC 38327]|uniref:Uncharacterized protein n=1 Tax=Allomyces macrogynus (strain ATCC 38327) TaxID=578462 RepID=A0A0L0T6Z1_ALLM3|nr:hypothetical protein AMAG_14494 [Allomyces macrogynus ATCC 38327]|eukprot:KNE70354.1 hypothetical protein AMAG_14494 [Allomyces macrogynus ATCC 38327]